MPSAFPRQTIEWHLEEPAAFRRLSLSLVEMALLTGVVLRLLRAFAFTHGRASVIVSIGAVVVWGLILVGMATAHLANFPMRRWFWRAPLFALVATVGEMTTSLLLIWLGREPNGTARAHFGDWPSMAARSLLQSELTLCLWMLILAGIIILVRRSGMARGVDAEPLVDPELDAPGR
jgi:NADH:ubiquinone oxidoreductase subunit 6 (subunit J)